MSFSYSSVTISAVEHTVMATPAQITSHLGTRLGAGPTAWTALTSANKDIVALMATRMFDRIAWDGARTDAANAHSWPRSGLLDREGAALSSATIPTDVTNALAELAGAIAQDSALYDRAEANAGARVQTLNAGPTSVTFFRGGTSSARLPVAVLELVRLWFEGVASPMAAAAYGTERPSAWNDGDSDEDDADDPVDRYGFDFSGGAS